jgi:hypothetical protein
MIAAIYAPHTMTDRRAPALGARGGRRCPSFPLRPFLLHTGLDLLKPIRATRRPPPDLAVRVYAVDLPMRDPPRGLAGIPGGLRGSGR